MKKATTLITEKRESHVRKGFGYEHDTEHTYMQFVNAARAYMYTEIHQWPFDRASFKAGSIVEQLVNAGSMIAAAIDRLQRYEVGKIYEKVNIMEIGDRFKVTKVKPRKDGIVVVYFVCISGALKPAKQSFMLGSKFDEDSVLSSNQE